MRARDAAFLAGMVALFLACVVRDPRSGTVPFLDFHPLPDAIEYAVAGASLAAGRGLALTIDGVAIPSRYPPGFPALIAVAHRVLGPDAANAYWVSIACGTVAIPLVFLWARAWLGSATTARWTTFFVATNALVLSFAPLVMSELCSLALALAALTVAVRLGPTARTGGFVLLGTLLAGGVLVRTANVLLLPLVALVLVVGHGRTLRLRQWSAVAVPLAVAAVGLAAYQAAVFGSPLRDGYALYTPRTMFAWEFFTTHAPSYVRTLVLASGGQTLWLDGPFWGPVIPGLVLIGVVALAGAGRRDVLLVAGTWVLLPVLFFASYFFFDFRFFIPVLPMILLLAGCGATRLLRGWGRRGRALGATAIVVLYLVQPSAGTSPLAAARRNRLGQDPPAAHLAMRALNATMDRLGARPDSHVVVTGLNLVYADHFSSGRYLLLPLGPHQEYARVPAVAARMPWRDVDRLLADGRRVYVTDLATDYDADARAAYAAFAATHRLEPIPDAGLGLARVHAAP